MGVFIGIDPGITGAIALTVDGEAFVWDVPTVWAEVNGQRRRRIDGRALQALANRLAKYEPDGVLIEDVWGQEGDGAVGAFSFGYATGRIAQAFEAAGLEVRKMAPKAWTRALGLPKGKEHRRPEASRHFPRSTRFFRRKLDHNRADAALIAKACEITACRS